VRLRRKICAKNFFDTMHAAALRGRSLPDWGFGCFLCNFVKQSKFFETFGGLFSKRGLLLKFLVLGWATSIGYFGSTAAGDLLPIKKGPQQPPVIGPRDRI
jgi:hypothetical protein